MPMPSSRSCRHVHRLLALLLVLAAPAVVRAQDVTEVMLKAAFIYNFAKFTEWPGGVLPPGSAVTACVVGDPAVGEALTRTVRGRQLAGRTIGVSMVPPDGPIPTCHLLYVSGLPAKSVSQIVSALRDVPVLTISDLGDFIKMGGIAQFFVQNGKMRFGINLGSARRARLQLSSRLLALADVVEEKASHAALRLPGLLTEVSPSRRLGTIDHRFVVWARRAAAWRHA